MTDSYKFTNNIQNVLKYIGTNFVKTTNRTEYTGDISIRGKGLNFVEAIIKGYSSFTIKYASSLPQASTVTNTTLTTDVYIRKLDATSDYTQMTDANITSFDSTTTEINYSKLITGDLLTELNNIKNAYTFLSDTNLSTWKSTSTPSFNVSNYRVVDSTKKSHIPYNNTTVKLSIETVLGPLNNFDFVQNDIFMIRRMLLLYELMTNIYISMYLYEKYTPPVSAGPGDRPRARGVDVSSKYITNISNTANILININKNFSISTNETPTERSNIIKNLNKNIQKYKTNSDTINDLDDTVRNQKMELASNQSTYKGARMTTSNTSKYDKIIMSIYIISIIAVVAIAISPLEKASRLILCGGILVVILLLAVILNNRYNKATEGFEVEDEEDEEEEVNTKEGFDNYYLPTPSSLSLGNTVADKTNLLAVYNQSFLSEALDYLNITVYLGALLQSNSTYSNINSTVQRELSYFNQMHDMIDNTNNKLTGAISITELEMITNSARATFFIHVGVILSIGIILYIASGDNPEYQPYLFGIVGLLLVFVIFAYLLKISKRVRTSPKQFYWDRPTNITILDS